jgi:transcriptional regulator with XRE-family HTH domain
MCEHAERLVAVGDDGLVTPPEPLTPGLVLRAWRQYAGFSLQQLTDALIALDVRAGQEPQTKSKGAVANWESGERLPTFEKVEKIASALGLTPNEQEAMPEMWKAAGSAAALPPRPYWEHNYADGGRPAWLWVRCPPDRGPTTIQAGWGPFGQSVEVPATEAGAMVNGPASAPNPPLQITFASPGWADFGHGVVPLAVLAQLGVVPVDGVVIFEGRFEDPPPLTAHEAMEVRTDLRAMATATSRFEVLWARIAPQLGAMRPNDTVQPLEGARIYKVPWKGGELSTDDHGELVNQLLQTPEQIKRIRRVGRSLSVKSAAQEANEPKYIQTRSEEISDNQLETMERSGYIPPLRGVIARLDSVYELDGHLGIERTFDSRTAARDRGRGYIIHFPDFWVGPVWLQVRAPSPTAEATLDLRWGHWRRRQRVVHSTIVTTRKAVPSGPNLNVDLPPGWGVLAGTGAVPNAVDINHDWYPATWKHAAQLVKEGFLTLRRGGHV